MKENVAFGAVSAIGTAATAWLGGWDVALKVLIVGMVFDYVTGVLAAAKRRQVNSEVMFWGGVRKAAVMLVIILAVLLDELLGNSAPIFRTLALYFYIGREGLSIVENLGLLNVPLPKFFTVVLEQIERKSNIVPSAVQEIDQPLGKPIAAVESEEIKEVVASEHHKTRA